jgi:catechol 2,3-dioxygenase-like lactoylglutathione lyase family enzyme
MILGAFADLCVADVQGSVAFYRQLLGFEVIADQEWYVELGVNARVALALVQSGHPTVPAAAGTRPTGLLVSFEVTNAAEVHEVARAMGCPFVLDLETGLGQKHFMVLDPDGALVDVIERVPLTREDRQKLVAFRRDYRARGRDETAAV